MSRSNGHCMTMGTASTMACVTEALGLTLPGGAADPGRRLAPPPAGRAAGRQIVDLVERDLKPSDILTEAAFENAIRALHAISGSTNAILHLIAYAGRVGVDLPLQLFDDLCATTPWLVDLKPAGRFLMEDFYYAGGLPAVHGADLGPAPPRRDHRDAAGPSARTSRVPRSSNPDVIRPADDPLDAGGALVVLRGSLCPDGAVMKITAADPRAAPARGPRDRLRGHPRPRRTGRRPRARVRREQRDGAAERRPRRCAGDAGVGTPADPGEAPEARRHRPRFASPTRA